MSKMNDHTKHYHCPNCGRCSNKLNHCPGPECCAPSAVAMAASERDIQIESITSDKLDRIGATLSSVGDTISKKEALSLIREIVLEPIAWEVPTHGGTQ